MQPRQVPQYLPRVGVIPALSPIEQHERLLEERTVRRSFGTRLSSRHFRNMVLRLDDFGAFQQFVNQWTPEVEIEIPDIDRLSGELDMYFREGRATREIAWVGDGLQIWLQILLYVYQLREADTIVLDEPEAFLHADLQRRLIRLLDSLGCQTILATHSAEIIAEANPEGLV